ncbi:MAG: GAF domain-containing protein [Candidatus Rokubacteria bacterium]|nr:GAF domain-containing protein [Candidatus Rokubacteria bacterium]
MLLAVAATVLGALTVLVPLSVSPFWRVVAVLALAVAGVAAFLAERRFSGALSDLTSVADALAAGELRAAATDMPAELRPLAEALESAGIARRAVEDARVDLQRREHAARRAAEAEALRAAMLTDAAVLLEAPLDDDVLASIARRVAATIAEWCVADIVEVDGTIRRVAVAHADPRRADVARALQLRYPPGPDGPATVSEALATGRSVLVPVLGPVELERRARNGEHLRLLRALGVHSIIAVPLVARGRIVGAFTLVRGGGESFDAGDLRTAEALAHRTALALANAQLEANVQEARDRFAHLMEGLDAIVWEADPLTLRFRFVSPRAEELLGYSIHRWIDEPEFWASIIHPDDRVASLERFARCGREHTNARFEYRAVTVTGDVVWLENVVHPVAAADEEPRRLHGFMLDISARKRLEEEHLQLLANAQAARADAESGVRRAKFLAESSQVLASSLDYEATLKAVTRLAVPTFADWCLVHLTEDGSRLQASHAEAVSPGVAEALDRMSQSADLKSLLPALDILQSGGPLLVPEISPAWLETVRLVQELSPRSVMIVPLIARGRTLGTLTFVWSQSGRRYDGADLALAEDLARRAAVAVDNARLYREAERANRTKDEFVATLSHELRTPLTAILGWVLSLRAGRLDAETADRALESIERNTRHQAQLINDLLDVSRIAAGKLTLDRRALDLRDVVANAVDSVRPDADRKELALRCETPDVEVPVFGDPMRLQQVALNLLANAIKFTPRQGRITVTVDRDGTRGRLTIEDSGQGIEADVLPHVFETFRQADGSSRRRHGGLGLGLAIVKELIELHGGAVGAASAGRDRGATFTVTLPILTVRVPAAPSEPGTDTRRIAGAALPMLDGVRVLVVDDHADARMVLESILAERGAKVVLATSAAEALAVLRSTYVDVLLSDIGMPDQSGYDLIQRVRERERAHGGRIPAVALTAYAGQEDRDRALAAGFQWHATKPITPAELIEVVAKAAGRGAA